MASEVSVDEIKRKLKKEEDWLKDMKDALVKSSQLKNNINSILDDFKERVTSLNDTVMPLYQKTAVIQRKQQNLKKLLGLIDATMKFYGKSAELENTVRDGNLSHDLNEFLDKMDSLKEAIAFFSSHSTYQHQIENMKQTYESGCATLEVEFINITKIESVSLEPIKILECLDDDYEILNFRVSSLRSMKDYKKLKALAKWLLENTSSTQYLNNFINYRSELMMRTIRNIMDQQNFLTNQHRHNPQKASLIKSAIKKATGRGNEKNTDLIENKDQAALITVLMLSALLILIQVETEVCANIFDDVKIQARVFKEIISAPFKSVMERCNSIIEQFDGAFGGILPLNKFLLRHAKQLQSLAENVRETQTFQKFQQNVYTRSSQLLSEFIDRLTNDNSRYVPEDGTVHHITSNTVNFLKMLARERATILQILDANSSTNRMQAQTNFSKLFAQILAALGVNLRNKSTTYTDEPLSALFMLNNLNHIRTCLFQDSHIESIISEQNDQISSFYEAEISSYTKKYLKSWQKVAAGFNLSELADEKRAIKMCYANFNKEFETILEAQKHYCIAEISLAVEIRNRIKGIVLRPFTEFTTKHSEDIYSSIDRQLKYDVESIEMMIDRLFDSST